LKKDNDQSIGGNGSHSGTTFIESPDDEASQDD
jgi:hypothetical protein